jgi:hypothetical protein
MSLVSGSHTLGDSIDMGTLCEGSCVYAATRRAAAEPVLCVLQTTPLQCFLHFIYLMAPPVTRFRL